MEAKRNGLASEVDRDHLKVYERVLARHNNFAIARVEDKVCQGCFISVTAQDVNLLMQGKFVQCKSCSRILFLG
jgi:predicted  nucleic acid-binding Zn-ribbon protein